MTRHFLSLFWSLFGWRKWLKYKWLPFSLYRVWAQIFLFPFSCGKFYWLGWMNVDLPTRKYLHKLISWYYGDALEWMEIKLSLCCSQSENRQLHFATTPCCLYIFHTLSHHKTGLLLSPSHFVLDHLGVASFKEKKKTEVIHTTIIIYTEIQIAL